MVLGNAMSLPTWMACTPADVIWRRRSLRLLRYRSLEGIGRRYAVPLLIVPSMINRHYVVDLMRGRSLVEHLIGRGVDCYLVDWGKASAEDRLLDVDACIENLLGAAVERVCRRSGVEQINLLGYCMGGTMCAIFTALRPQRVAALVNLAGPIDFGVTGVLKTWTDRRFFDPDRIVDGLGNLPGWLMQAAFSALTPTANAAKVLAVLERIDDPVFIKSFTAIETWANDSVPFPGEAYRKYIRELYQENRFAEDRYRLRGRPARLSAIRCSVAVITAARDPIVPRASAVALIDRCSSDDTEHMEIRGGHVGIVVGSGAKTQLWPALDGWLLPRSGARPRMTAELPQVQRFRADGARGERR